MHPHKREALESVAHKMGELTGGKMTAGAGTGEGRLQKIALQNSHPALDDGGGPSNYTDLGGEVESPAEDTAEGSEE